MLSYGRPANACRAPPPLTVRRPAEGSRRTSSSRGSTKARTRARTCPGWLWGLTRQTAISQRPGAPTACLQMSVPQSRGLGLPFTRTHACGTHAHTHAHAHTHTHTHTHTKAPPQEQKFPNALSEQTRTKAGRIYAQIQVLMGAKRATTSTIGIQTCRLFSAVALEYREGNLLHGPMLGYAYARDSLLTCVHVELRTLRLRCRRPHARDRRSSDLP